MLSNLQGELSIMNSLKEKPNYAALGRKYGMDWRTVKKYHEGYEGKPRSRNKGSKLDYYKGEIQDKLQIKRLTVKGAYEFFVNKYSRDRIGSYTNFNKYVRENKLKIKKASGGHPRYEKEAGEQAQVDWKEDITLTSRSGEKYTVNILHMSLKYSRYSYIDLSLQKRFEDVARGLIKGFMSFGGVPKELLFDNMSTVANINVKPKEPTKAIKKLGKDFGFNVRLCGTKKPETKGSVEAKNKVIDWIRAYNEEFEGLEELTEKVEELNRKMQINICQETGMSPCALFYKEKEYLQPLPTKDIIDSYLTPIKYKVSDESLIKYGESRYSVNPKLIGQEVTVDQLDNKLHIYYNGKLVAVHTLNENPINYIADHYRTLMSGKVKQDDLEKVVANNLSVMDRLLEERKVTVSEAEATKSELALIAYINQSEYGRWIIEYYAHLPLEEQLTFIKSMNTLLPYVGNKEALVSNIKQSMKENKCKTLDFDCWIHDFVSANKEQHILTDEGYGAIQNKYSEKIKELIDGGNY